MVIKEYKKKGYDIVELWDGIDCNTGNTNYSVYTSRKDFTWIETFLSKKEAEKWIKHIL